MLWTWDYVDDQMLHWFEQFCLEQAREDTKIESLVLAQEALSPLGVKSDPKLALTP